MAAGFTVESARRGGANTGVNRREDVQHHGFPPVIFQADFRKISFNESEFRSCGTNCGKGTYGLNLIALKSDLGHFFLLCIYVDFTETYFVPIPQEGI